MQHLQGVDGTLGRSKADPDAPAPDPDRPFVGDALQFPDVDVRNPGGQPIDCRLHACPVFERPSPFSFRSNAHAAVAVTLSPMAYQPADLDALEKALLGVLCLGLPPSRAAGSDTFRVDHVTAVVAGLLEADQRDLHLEADGQAVTQQFRLALRATIASLTEKGIVTQQAAGMPAAPGGYEAGLAIDIVNPDEHPVVLDRYLAQLCMEELFNVPAVYPYLMERYAKAGEVWRRLQDEGYGRD